MSFEEIKVPLMRASVQLLSDSKAIPVGGLSAQSHRVELAMVGEPNERWIAVLNVLGDLPWFRGECRDVDVKVMSHEFGEALFRPGIAIAVFRGPELVGHMSIKPISAGKGR